MRNITPQAIELIKYFEGFSPVPYRCPAGIMTVGFGHILRPGEVVSEEGISREQAVQWLREDAAISAQAVLRLIRVPLTDGQFDALVSFTFNLGAGALQRSTLRRKVNREEHEDVPEEFGKWVWTGGKKLKGLIARRNAEVLCYLS